MKSTATMTWLHNGNYGTLLQAYALQKVLLERGYENTIIDYQPGKLMKAVNLFTSGNSVKLFYYKFQAFIEKKKTVANGVSRTVGVGNKDENIQKFIKECLQTVGPFTIPSRLKSVGSKYDTYICGSDQIWNPELLNPPYYLNFVEGNKKKVAYAPSFGVKKIRQEKKAKRIKKFLSEFDAISVREKQGADIVAELFPEKKDIPVVLDPTLLLSKEEWNEIALGEKKEKYLLCYFLRENEKYRKAADYIAEELNLKIKVVSEWPGFEDCESYADAGPREWIGLVKNADFVLTDSFHCVLFSMMNHIDFYVYKRFPDNSTESQNSRIENILNMTHLEERLLNVDETLSKVKGIETYNEVDSFIATERARSLEYLFNAIES